MIYSNFMDPKVKRILVVDDEAGMRIFLSRLLSRNGFDVESADSGERALELFAPGKFDAALIDVELGSLDGIELARRLREKEPKLKLILMSGSPVNEPRVKEAGFGSFLMKPFQTEEILSLLRG